MNNEEREKRKKTNERKKKRNNVINVSALQHFKSFLLSTIHFFKSGFSIVHTFIRGGIDVFIS